MSLVKANILRSRVQLCLCCISICVEYSLPSMLDKKKTILCFARCVELNVLIDQIMFIVLCWFHESNLLFSNRYYLFLEGNVKSCFRSTTWAAYSTNIMGTGLIKDEWIQELVYQTWDQLALLCFYLWLLEVSVFCCWKLFRLINGHDLIVLVQEHDMYI